MNYKDITNQKWQLYPDNRESLAKWKKARIQISLL